MSWTLTYGESTDADQLVISSEGNFDISATRTTSESGQTQYTEVFVTARGVITSSIESSVTSYLEDVIATHNDKRLTISGTSATVFDSDDYGCIGSPILTAFETVPTEGQGESDWEYVFRFYIKVRGNSFGGAHELYTSIRVLKDKDGKVTTKVWKSRCKHETVEEARATVLSFKPSDPDITEDIEVFYQENACNGVWQWTKEDSSSGATGGLDGDPSDVLEVVENPPQYVGFGADFIIDQQVAADGQRTPPVLHLAQDDGAFIRISGIVRGKSENIPVPLPHFQNSDSLQRAGNRETHGTAVPDPDPINRKLGLWIRPFEEIWIWSGGDAAIAPAPNHNGHLDIAIISEPADGAAGGTV